jgi:predicted PurR-regulated permease PerM
MQMLILLVATVVMYFVADRLVDFLEQRAGRRFEYRSIVFLVIFLALLLVVFTAIQDIAAL